MVRRLASTVCLWSVVLAACGPSPEQQARAASEALIEKVKQTVTQSLVDPGSAQFRNVVAYSEGVVCGEVNGKNRQGEWVGFKKFVFNADDSGEVRYDEWNPGLWCSNEPRKRLRYHQRQATYWAEQCDEARRNEDKKDQQTHCRWQAEHEEAVKALEARYASEAASAAKR